MIIENPAALQFIINEQIYLAKSDIGKPLQPVPVMAVADEPAVIAAPVVSPEPVIAETLIVAEPEPAVQAPVINFNYWGKNAKGFLIVCHYASAEMDEKHFAALTSTLQRKELSLDDVALVNLAQHAEATVEQLQSFFKPQRLLILGAQCRLPGWDALPLNQLTDLTGYKVLYTDSFTDMMGDRDRTKAFWEQMKQL